MADHDIARLPQWAQATIRNLQAEVARLREHVNQADTPETDTYLDDVVHDSMWPLGESPWIRYHLEPKVVTGGGRLARRGTLDVSISTRFGRRVLQVRTSEGGIVVRAVGGNEITVATEDWV